MNKDNYILVNKDNPYVAENYKDEERIKILIPIADNEIVEDEDIITIDEKGKKWSETYIAKETYEKFLSLQAKVKEKYGIEIQIIEAGRTEKKQELYFNNAIKNHDEEYANNYVAKPGYSEHHTGRAFDYSLRNPKIAQIKQPIIKKIVYKLAKPGMFYLVNNEAAKLGLLLRYPMFCKKYTQFKHERWHLTDIKNPALASYLRVKNLPLEKFYAYPKKYAEDYENYRVLFEALHSNSKEDDHDEMEL